MADEKKNIPKSHNVIIESRQNVMFSGVLDVSGFNDNCVSMYTEGGALVLKGSELHIVRLSLETGEVSVEGNVDSLVYSSRERRRNESLLTRLFK